MLPAMRSEHAATGLNEVTTKPFGSTESTTHCYRDRHSIDAYIFIVDERDENNLI